MLKMKKELFVFNTEVHTPSGRRRLCYYKNAEAGWSLHFQTTVRSNFFKPCCSTTLFIIIYFIKRTLTSMNYFLACSFIIRYRCSLNKGNRFVFVLCWWLFHKLYRWAVSERCFWWSESQSQSSHSCLRHYKWKAKSQTDKHNKRNAAC